MRSWALSRIAACTRCLTCTRKSGCSLHGSSPATAGWHTTAYRAWAGTRRASASLIIAGLVAEDETEIRRVYHLDRGFERIKDKLGQCGTQIERLAN